MQNEKKKVVVFHGDKCLLCKNCELACSVSHTESKKIHDAVVKAEPTVRRRWVKTYPGSDVSISCQHCDPAPCVNACISAAMMKGENGVTIHDENKCVGCWMCIMVCPFGALKRLQAKHAVAKCDLCDFSHELACVKSCPTKALEIREVEHNI